MSDIIDAVHREYDFNDITPSDQIKRYKDINYLTQLLKEVGERTLIRVDKRLSTLIYVKLMLDGTDFIWYLTFNGYEGKPNDDNDKLYLTNGMVKMLFQNFDLIGDYVGVPQELRPFVEMLHQNINDIDRKDTIIYYADKLSSIDDTFRNRKIPTIQDNGTNIHNLSRYISRYNKNIKC
jgi:hypothetical protein